MMFVPVCWREKCVSLYHQTGIDLVNSVPATLQLHRSQVRHGTHGTRLHVCLACRQQAAKNLMRFHDYVACDVT